MNTETITRLVCDQCGRKSEPMGKETHFGDCELGSIGPDRPTGWRYREIVTEERGRFIGDVCPECVRKGKA